MPTRNERRKMRIDEQNAMDATRRWDYGKAIYWRKQLIADCERILGPDHPDTLTARANLAGLHIGGVEECEQLIADCERVLGPDHRVTRTLRANLADYRARLSTPPYSGPLSYWDPSWQ